MRQSLPATTLNADDCAAGNHQHLIPKCSIYLTQSAKPRAVGSPAAEIHQESSQDAAMCPKAVREQRNQGQATWEQGGEALTNSSFYTFPSAGRGPMSFSPLLGDGREPSSSGRELLFLPTFRQRQRTFFLRQRTALPSNLSAKAENLLPPEENRSFSNLLAKAENLCPFSPLLGRGPISFSPLLGDGREPSSSDREPLFLPTFRQRQRTFFLRQRTALPSNLSAKAENLLPPAENRSFSNLSAKAENLCPFSPLLGEGREPDTMLTSPGIMSDIFYRLLLHNVFSFVISQFPPPFRLVLPIPCKALLHCKIFGHSLHRFSAARRLVSADLACIIPSLLLSYIIFLLLLNVGSRNIHLSGDCEVPCQKSSLGFLGCEERASETEMGHSNVWNSHPKTYGPGSWTCRVCGNSHGLIRKYGLMCCRQSFRNNAKEISFIKYQ
ncbi:hypothetical protein M5K25_022011 [Dendrobium thyrsiflorum]|uniref:Uncharacterized protein n=1 Tax=Dendrobium thyrsiflorum TaxID=117978 RepID=A0ABD0U5I6_DENTH